MFRMHSEGSLRMIDRSPAPWPLAPVALFPVPAPSARVEDRIVSMVRDGGQDHAAAVAAAPVPGPRDLEFSGVVSPVSLATLRHSCAPGRYNSATARTVARSPPDPGRHNRTDVALHPRRP